MYTKEVASITRKESQLSYMKSDACISISKGNCTENHHFGRPTSFILKEFAVIINKLTLIQQGTLITLDQEVSVGQCDSLIGNCGCEPKEI